MGDASAVSARRLWVAFGVCAFLACAPLWTVEFLPLIDLPQHAAQVAMWQRIDQPGSIESQNLEINWFTPYLLAYVLARLLASVVSIHTAFALLVTAAVLAIPLSLLALIRRTGGNPWWALLGFPVAFNYSFHWGFINFLVGTPIAIAFCALLLWYLERPGPARLAAWLSLLGLLLLNHVLIFGACGLIAAAILLPSAPDWRSAARRVAALSIPLPLVGWWLWHTRSAEPMAELPTVWDLGTHRVLDMLSHQLGQEHSFAPTARLAVGALILGIPLLTGGKLARSPHRWLPLAVILALVLFAPRVLMGTGFIAGRYAAFVLPMLVLALDWAPRRPEDRRQRQLAALAPAVAAIWLASLAFRFWAYDSRAAAFKDVVAELEPNRRVLYLAIQRNDPALEGPVFLHFGSWYAAVRGGIVDFSFARNYPSLVRYRDEAMPPLPQDFEWSPHWFHGPRHGADLYDYVIVRAPANPTGWLARRTGGRIRPVTSAGDWWVFAREPVL